MPAQLMDVSRTWGWREPVRRQEFGPWKPQHDALLAERAHRRLSWETVGDGCSGRPVCSVCQDSRIFSPGCCPAASRGQRCRWTDWKYEGQLHGRGAEQLPGWCAGGPRSGRRHLASAVFSAPPGNSHQNRESSIATENGTGFKSRTEVQSPLLKTGRERLT